MAEKRLPNFVGPGLPAFPQKRLKTSSSEISNVYSATQSVSSELESDSCIGKLGNNEMQEDSDDEDSYTEETDDDENLEDSDDEDSYTEKTEDDENQKGCDDDEADRSLLYCMILSEDGRIDLNSTDWYGGLTNIRKTYKMKHRSREKDIITIKSMIETHHIVSMSENFVMCLVGTKKFYEHDWVYNCLTFNKDYDKFLKVTPTEVLRKCVPYMTNIQETIICGSEISDIVLKFGLDFVRFYHTRSKYSKIYEDGLKIMNLPHHVVNMLDDTVEIEEFSEFKEYVGEIMKCEHKSLKSLNLNSLLGSYLIGRDTGKEKALDNLALSQTKWNILVSILMSESYSLSLSTPREEISRKLQSAFPLLSCGSRMLDSDIAELTDIYKVLNKENNSVKFISDDVRHQVMSYFVKNCLITDENYENYIKLSSVDLWLEYVRPWWYDDDEMFVWGEKIMFLPESLEDLFLQRLGLDVLRHVMVEWNGSTIDRIKTVREAVKKKLKLPSIVFCEIKRNKFVEYVKKISKEKQASIQPLNLNSLFGSFLIGRGDYSSEVPEILALSQTKKSILVSILISESYSLSLSSSWEEILTKLQSAFPLLKCDSKTLDSDITELKDISKVLSKENNSVRFISDDVRHQVMSYFVRNCLITDEDYESYINQSSVDSLLEYVRPWWYMVDEFTDLKKCLFLPETLEDSFFQRLGLDVLRHPTISYGECYEETTETFREKVKDNFNVPEEIFDWEYDARCRYIECAKRGTKTVHRARAMIVGCAGAGKTTLLKRLEKLGLEELLKVGSTVGLEVHEDMFELDEDSSLRALSDSTDKDDKQILSVVDFGGQCAYYACHQVYLSRRAFYLLVIDMSKPFTEKVDENKCEQRETMFADWTYGEYVLFWLKSIHTYCAEDTSVIIVATHSENATQKEKDGFYSELLDLLPTDSNLKKHLSYERCFFVSFPCDKGENLEVLSELENCIASIAKDKRWKEDIPKEWSIIELALITMRNSENTLPIEYLQEKYWKTMKDEGLKMEDALCFFHDIGLILHFKEENLSDTIIVDIQWFVDTFKFIISDKNHVRDLAETDKDWQYFNKTGYLMDNFLSRIWENLSIDSQERPTILQYMQRLGLLAIGEVKHYVPCMNKRDFGKKERIALRGMETKSSVLVLHFQFLPFFFYCRLIVACIVGTEWKVVEDDGIPGLYKNIAIFVYRDHLIALVVTQTAIQVQILRPQNSPIDANIAVNIKETLEKRLGYLTSTFHKQVAYRVAYQCSDQDVLCQDVRCYVYEEEIAKKGLILCPRHGFTEKHMINEEDLTKFWKITASSVSGTSTKSVKVPLTNEEKLKKLIILGRDALQIYFDSIFPSEDLQKCLKDNKESLCNGPYRFTATEVSIVYPASGSVVKSSLIDVPIMYKLLRNFGSNVPSPTNGWGKEPMVGQKTKGDDIERIRKYRNKLCHNHFNGSNMDNDDFEDYWGELAQAISRLTNGSFKSRMNTIFQ